MPDEVDLDGETARLQPIINAAIRVVEMWHDGSGEFTPNVGFAIDELWRALRKAKLA